MFSLINLILSIVILIRVYKYDKFFIVTYDMKLQEDKRSKDKKYER